MQTGSSDKSVPDVVSIRGIVEDSPHKIFVGSISKLLSSRMLLEIARAFGLVKAFHFERIADTNEPCAFLEACAGLNGMMLGGQVLTAVLATPEPDLENAGQLPTYVIPEHAKPLIKKPTTVLLCLSFPSLPSILIHFLMLLSSIILPMPLQLAVQS
ncbi:splicing factor U2AF 50 kDa subunit-like isoform X2 [Salvia splendens]|uniref:splicing factor U2AF 50 kDa subunit-like isoform X2 n=1 Tax=Salvia splendens TaxID=180675 RepID=UPI001C274FEE|nr:splicing factor U2AF 50 kDa subunit-like isoform X2 [Salvia splendens]